jgi:hypothetical protein
MIVALGLQRVINAMAMKQMERPDTRRWQRLPVAVPVFARGTDEKGRSFTEFTTMLNLGGGGGLLVFRRSAPRAARMVVEFPSPALPGLMLPSNCTQTLKSRVVHVTPSGPYDLLGVEFIHPLLMPQSGKPSKGQRPRGKPRA